MDTYRTVLYLHILSLLVGMGAGGVLIVCLFQLRAARTAEEASPFGRIAGKTALAFPVAILGLFASGAYMTSDAWSWGTRWIDVALAGLVVLMVQGPILNGRLAKQLEQSLHANGPGPLGVEALRMARRPLMWGAELSGLGLVLGIVWNMTQKPGLGEAIAAAVVGYAAGMLVGAVCARAGAPGKAPALDPA